VNDGREYEVTAVDLEMPMSESAVAVIQRLQAKFVGKAALNGQCASTISSEQIVALLLKMEEMNRELQNERDEHRKAVYAWVAEKFANDPLPAVNGPMYDNIDELIQEIAG
jgi:hypothetical protein